MVSAQHQVKSVVLQECCKMAKCNRSPRASTHTKMFTYIKFEDGVKAIVNTDDIVDFDIRNILFDKKYRVKWDDGHFYYGILGKIQQKVILEGKRLKNNILMNLYCYQIA